MENESDCLIIADIVAFVKANTMKGHMPLPKQLIKHVDILFERYDTALDAEGCQPVEHRVILQHIHRMIRGEPPMLEKGYEKSGYRKALHGDPIA